MLRRDRSIAEHRQHRANLDTPHDTPELVHNPYHSWKHSFFIPTALLSALLALFLAGTFAGSDLSLRRRPINQALSNGTHDFGRTVVLVSIDGFRADYLTRGLTPHLLDICAAGIRAEFMKPIFPVCYFLQVFIFVTGLYAESHGMIGNDFYDPQLGSSFTISDPDSSHWRWWHGEPIWETVQRAGLPAASIMWPGPQTTSSGISPTYYVPFKMTYTPEDRITQVLDWIDLPIEERPRLILVYEPLLDQAGHVAGPESELVNKTLPIVSDFAHALVHHLHSVRNLSHIVDVIIVSDHGMEDTSKWEMVYVDDILCDDVDASDSEQRWPACAGVDHVDGWPSMGLWFKPGVNPTPALSRLIRASESGKFDVYTSATYITTATDNTDDTDDTKSMLIPPPPTMPERYHYSSSPRLAPVWVIPRLGYALTDRVENGTLMSTGNHGYDNEEPSMRAVFMTQGPFADGVKRHLRRTGGGALDRRSETMGRYRDTEDECNVLPSFANVELYNLVVRLLGVEHYAAETNGTRGFWDLWDGGREGLGCDDAEGVLGLW
ncbi:Phosphodiest-domain-containing protein [Phlebopus sp. FC_14]|nr:Phosphodiest-domain-containing protein [Phlebopus sp. FC_14]